MADDRTSGLNRNIVTFSSANNSSNIADVPNRKNSKEDYYRLEKNKEEEEDKPKQSEFVDRSAQLRASLASLAMINAPTVKKKNPKDIKIPAKKEQPEKEE